MKRKPKHSKLFTKDTKVLRSKGDYKGAITTITTAIDAILKTKNDDLTMMCIRIL